MTQLLIQLPDSLAARFRALIPTRKRSKYIEELIAIDLARKDSELFASALAIEDDQNINNLIDDLNILAGDGIDE